MTTAAVHQLAAASHQFDAKAARLKLRLLAPLAEAAPPDPADRLKLQDTLNFMRAYPDDAELLRAVEQVVATLRQFAIRHPRRAAARRLQDSGLPGAVQRYSYHYGVVRELLRAAPACLEIDWDEFEDEGGLLDALRLALPVAEIDGLEDERLGLQEWFAGCRPRGTKTDLELLVALLERSGHAEAVRVHLYDSAEVPLCYELATPGTARCEVRLPVRRIHYQHEPVERERYPLAPLIRERLAVPRPMAEGPGRSLVRTALYALCSRNLAIYPLIYANPRDVTRVSCRRGLEVVLIGTRPPFRAAFETLYFYLIVKNGVPLAYGPAGVFLGVCEMGINLFPEFRGGEIRFIYSQLMRVLRHALGVSFYYLLPYGMGEDNPEAIASGAFWFYRKLGFRASNPKVELLAQQEEERIRAEPGYRSDATMLRRLSHTHAEFDLSGGRGAPFDFANLGLKLNRFVSKHFGASRLAAEQQCARRIARQLGLKDLARWSADERAALAAMAPTLAMFPDLDRWSARERTALGRAIRAKGARSEARAARALSRHERFAAAMGELAS